MNKATPLDQEPPQSPQVEPIRVTGMQLHAGILDARPLASGSHEQLMRAAVVAALRAAATAAELRRAFDAERSARAAGEAE